MNHHLISTDFLKLEDIQEIIQQGKKLELGQEAKEKIISCRKYLDDKIKRSVVPIYGINTGFGSLHDKEVSEDDLEKLQRNLVTSHACGMGEEVPEDIVQLMLLLKVQGLSQGHSGAQLITIQRLIDFYNEGVSPVVYQQGSLGASGDLAPLAHLVLPLLGEGEVNYKEERYSGKAINEKMGWDVIALQSKEGLALLNGTQFMSSYATHLLIRLEHLSKWGDLVGAASLDGFDGRAEPFNALVHKIRPHQGQLETAENIREHLKDSELIKQTKKHVQDPYCFRCIPQVHGASKDTLRHAKNVVETEINAVTDNPTIFEEDDLVISAGNFHGQPLALILDFLAIAAAELASISERRTYKLISGQRGLPPFLVKNAGLNSGFMIAQYSAASAVSQNKQLATPASVDTIDSSNGQEDHVSMGANAATKLHRVVDNYEKILAIEWFTACQALDFRTLKSSSSIEKAKVSFRERVAFIEEDTTMYNLIAESIAFLKETEAQ